MHRRLHAWNQLVVLVDDARKIVVVLLQLPDKRLLFGKLLAEGFQLQLLEFGEVVLLSSFLNKDK